MKQHLLWVEKYRPKSISEFVFKNDKHKELISSWLKEKDLPHVLLYGPPGRGKTSLINVLLNELGIEDVLEINCSLKTSIDDVREEILNYSKMVTFGKFKIIVLEEMEMMSTNAQSSLKRILEEYSANTRFILTTNNISRVDDAIVSRCQEIKLDVLDPQEFIKRCVEVLVSENIEANPKDVDAYVKIYYPDLRKTINVLQQNTINKKLIAPNSDDSSNNDLYDVIFNLFKTNKINDARKLLNEKISLEMYLTYFEYLYNNLDKFWKEPTDQDKALIFIRNGLVNHELVARKEINLAATLVELARI